MNIQTKALRVSSSMKEHLSEACEKTVTPAEAFRPFSTPLGNFLGHLGAVFETPLEALMDHLHTLLGYLGALLETFRVILVSSWELLVSS